MSVSTPISTSAGAVTEAPVAPLAASNNQTKAAQRERALQRLVTAYITTGLLFMLLPGTFLGVWNLFSTSAEHSSSLVSAAWIQAHGHAQIFGWIGTFIIGIGFYSLSKMGAMPSFAVPWGWTAWVLWTTGVAMRWVAGVETWHWRRLVPLSAELELAGFLIFFITLSRPKRAVASIAPILSQAPKTHRQPWLLVVLGATFGFLASLVWNLVLALQMAHTAAQPAIPHAPDQKLLLLLVWAFLVPTVWGFNARWLPVFAGISQPNARLLLGGYLTSVAGILVWLAGWPTVGTALLTLASLAVLNGLHILDRPKAKAKVLGVHRSFPTFVRLPYAWLLLGCALTMWALRSDLHGGIWGASRHAITVGFLAMMVFAIGPRILPAFCGNRVLFSPRLMFAALALLNVGCFLRVGAEILAYEGYWAHAWHCLPVSAVIELTAVALFALNMLLTLLSTPPHIKTLANA